MVALQKKFARLNCYKKNKEIEKHKLLRQVVNDVGFVHCEFIPLLYDLKHFEEIIWLPFMKRENDEFFE